MRQYAALSIALPEVTVPSGVPNGGAPGVEEVGAEGQHVVGVLDVEVRHDVLAEHPLYRGAFRRALECLVR